jgi:hypothetical protein
MMAGGFAPSMRSAFMSRAPNPRLEELREELSQLMLEQVKSLKAQTFGGLSEEELRRQDERLNRIREVSADFLAMLKEEQK